MPLAIKVMSHACWGAGPAPDDKKESEAGEALPSSLNRLDAASTPAGSGGATTWTAYLEPAQTRSQTLSPRRRLPADTQIGDQAAMPRTRLEIESLRDAVSQTTGAP